MLAALQRLPSRVSAVAAGGLWLATGCGGNGVVALALRPALAQEFATVEPLASALGTLADTATVEHARCLFGRTEPGAAVADSAVEPHVWRRTGLLVSVSPCPFGALALWHVHVLTQTKATQAEDACFLSPGDVEAGLQPNTPMVMVVQVSRDVWCWWTKEDVLDARLARHVVAPPPPGQLYRRGR